MTTNNISINKRFELVANYVGYKIRLASAGNGFYDFALNTQDIKNAKFRLGRTALEYIRGNTDLKELDDAIGNWLYMVYQDTKANWYEKMRGFDIEVVFYEDVFLYKWEYEIIIEAYNKWFGTPFAPIHQNFTMEIPEYKPPKKRRLTKAEREEIEYNKWTENQQTQNLRTLFSLSELKEKPMT